jgi:predicted HTH transcriptional regulator
MIEDLFAKRTRNSIGKITSPRQDLAFAQLKIYYEETGLTLNDNFAKNLELLTEDGKYNYAAYLMADENGISIKLAKYSGSDRVDLIENNEYGYCSLIKATNAVLDKLDIENRTSAKITSKKRMERRLWDAVAVREAVINAIVHNDYSREIPPKFEIFSDRLEITSYGGLFEGMTQDDFFEGLSLPRNKELMRIFKDLEMVEQLGSGVPRILKAYAKDCFKFSDNYIRMTFPASEPVYDESSVKSSVKSSVRIMELIKQNKNITIPEIARHLEISTRAVEKQIARLKEQGILKRIGPDKGGYWEAAK